MAANWIIEAGKWVRLIPAKITVRRMSKEERKAREKELGAVRVGKFLDEQRGLTPAESRMRDALAAFREGNADAGLKFDQPDDPGENEYPKPAKRRHNPKGTR